MKRLGEILLGRGLVTADQLAEALKTQVIYGGRLGTLLVQFGFLRIDDLGRCLSIQHGVPQVSMEELEGATMEARKLLTRELAERCNAIPVALEGQTLRLAMADPRRNVAGEVSFELGLAVQRLVSPELRIKYFLERYYGVPRDSMYLRRPKEKPEQHDERRKYVVPTLEVAPEPPATAGEDNLLEEMGIVTLEEYRKSQTGLHPQVPSGEDPPVSAASPLDLLGFKLDSASTGDEIANLLVEPCLEGAAASVLFWVRDDYAFGCCASGVPAGGAELRKLVISLRARSVLQYAHDAKVMIHGIGESDALHAGIARRMGLPLPAEVCVAPVLLRETVICLLYLVSGADEGFAAGAQQDLRRLTSRAARAYERLVGEMALADG